MIEIPKQFLDELVEEAKADEVGLWFIIGGVHHCLGIEDASRVRQMTLECVRLMLKSKGISAGFYSPDGYEIWDMPVEAIVARIEAGWDRLGREPNIGEVVVLFGRHACSPHHDS